MFQTIGVFLAQIVALLVDRYHEEITVLAKGEIGKLFQGLFHQRAIMILGARASGKTALLCLLQKGKPYFEVNGQKEIPSPTAGVVVVDDKIQISKEAEIKWGCVRNDVPGDFRDEWKRLIPVIDPHGIIYMIDGRLDGDALRHSVEEVFDDVLSEYRDEIRNLSAFHIFVNFSDEWCFDRRIEARKKNEVSDYFEEIRDTPAYARLSNLPVMVSATQLSPDKTAWKETERALEHFAADLAGRHR